jgi:hypothetical protein
MGMCQQGGENTWSGWGQFSFLKENQKLSSQQINQQQCLET